MMNRVLVAALVVVAGCGDAPFGPPSEAGPLRLETAVSRTTLAVGDTATVTHRLVNTGSTSLELVFGSGCVILPFITGRDTDQVIYPQGGAWACTTVVTRVLLAPGEARERSFGIRGGAPQLAIYSELPLDEGRYLVFATVGFEGVELRSVPVRVTVR